MLANDPCEIEGTATSLAKKFGVSLHKFIKAQRVLERGEFLTKESVVGNYYALKIHPRLKTIHVEV